MIKNYPTFPNHLKIQSHVLLMRESVFNTSKLRTITSNARVTIDFNLNAHTHKKYKI